MECAAVGGREVGRGCGGGRGLGGEQGAVGVATYVIDEVLGSCEWGGESGVGG